MKKHTIFVLSLLAIAFFTGCSDQKATATRQRWMEIKTATDNLDYALMFINQATSASKETEDAFAEPLAQATSKVNACRQFYEAISSQKTVNVDPRLNALAENLCESSKVLMSQMQKIQEDLITAQRLQTEHKTADDFQKDRIALEATNVKNEIYSTLQIAAETLMQISGQYQELETLRLELNKQYGFELPQIKWMNQQ